MAARTMGYRVRVMDPEASVPGEFCCRRNDRGPLGRCGCGAAAGSGRGCCDAGDRADRRGRAARSCADCAAAAGRGADPHHPGQDTAENVARGERISGRAVSRGAQRGGVARGGGCAGRRRVSEDRATAATMAAARRGSDWMRRRRKRRLQRRGKQSASGPLWPSRRSTWSARSA